MRIILFLSLLGTTFSYKILMYSIKYGYSHMNYIGSIADTLQAAGHNVTVIQPEVDLGLKTSGCSLAKVITVPIDDHTSQVLKERREHDKNFDMWTLDDSDPRHISSKSPSVARIYSAAMHNVLKQKELLEQLRKEKFDLGIFELLDYAGYPVLYELGIDNIIGCLSVVLADRVATNLGLPATYSYVPALQSRVSDDGSFISRLWNLIFVHYSTEYERLIEMSGQDYMDENHPDAPKITQVVADMPLVLTNSEPLLDFPRPTLQKVVDVGGIGFKPAKPLTEDFVNLLSRRKTNVLVSFGSLAKSSLMPKEFKNSVVQMIKKFPDITFIWKYETPEDGVGAGVDNLVLSTWTPQTDLLASGRISLFITHGGAGSILESSTLGVPMVTIPIFGDQYRNSLMAERFGHAIYLTKENLRYSEKLTSVVEKALGSKEMKEKATFASELLKNRPFTPQEKLVKNVEMAVRFGNKLSTLSPSGRHFNVIQFYNLDILALFIVVSLFVFFVLLKLFRWLAKFGTGKKKLE